MERKIKSFYTDENKIYINLEDNSLMEFDNTIPNLKNVDDLLKVQAEDRIAEIDRELYHSEPVTGGEAAICLIGYAGVVASVFCGIYGVAAMAFGNQDNLGTILLSASLGSAAVAIISKTIISSKEKRYYKNKQDLREEKEKLEFLNENVRVLRKYPKYSNSLSGLTKEQVEYIENSELPFTVLDIDKFSIEDLERIQDNISIESKFVPKEKRQKVKNKMR